MERFTIQAVLRMLRGTLASIEQATGMARIVEEERPEVRAAAVLLALFERDEKTFLLFIRRAPTLRAHGGEMAFPGGRVEAADASPAMTALREAQEEIGLAPERVEVLGALAPVFTVTSNYLITPVVGFLPHGPGNVCLQESEVAELILMPLHELANPAIARTEVWGHGDTARTIYFYDYGPYCIWGATGRILHTFLHLLKESCPQASSI